MKFVLFVEGETERRVLPPFLKKWLDPRVPQRITIEAVNLKGGSNVVKESAGRAMKHLEGPKKSEIIAIAALVDLYGLTLPYPRSLETYKEKCAWAKDHLENEVKHPNFFQFFAVHEVEAWLLSDPAIFPPKIKQFLEKINKPETVNFDEPPAKLLNRLYSQHVGQEYKKLTHGTELFNKLDPAVAYDKCEHLKAMLDKMLHLAQQH